MAVPRRNPWKWIACLLAATTIHAVWWFGLRFDWDPPRPAPAGPAGMVWLREADAAEWSRTVDLWSPTLFALPSVHGFSSPLLRETVAVRPPVEPPPPVNWALDRAALDVSPAVQPSVAWSPWEVLREREEDLPLRVPVPAAARGERRFPATAVPAMEPVENGRGRRPQTVDWPVGAAFWGDQPWTAELLVQVDEQGMVTLVLLDGRTEQSAVDETLVRTAYAWRWAPGPGSERFRVRVRYAGVPPSPGREQP